MQVVGHGEVAEPATVVAGFDRDAREDFLLAWKPRSCPIPRTDAPALEDRGIVRLAEHVLPEVGFQICPHEVTSACAEILRERVEKIAVGREVAVGIGPRPRHADGRRRRRGDDARRRIGGRVVVRCCWSPRSGTCPVHLRDVLPVAEQVIGHADPRGDDRCSLRRRPRRNTIGDRNERLGADLLVEELAAGMVVAQGSLQRQPAEGRLILRVERAYI